MIKAIISKIITQTITTILENDSSGLESGGFLLLENGDFLLLENGDLIEMENYVE
jgi:hypothetical protein